MADKRSPAPDKALGQHFLFDRSILGKIVAGAGVEVGDRVLEIGPGPGGLTNALLDAGAAVTAVEADQRMVAHLEAEGRQGLTLIHDDALKIDYLKLAEDEGGTPFKLVANLPYNISGVLTAKLLRERAAFESMTLMFQKEVADRLGAPAGTKTRGRLSVLAQTFCEVKRVMTVPAGAFRPPPKVASAVISLKVRREEILSCQEENLLWKLVKECFGQKRKMLRNTLKPRGEAGEIAMKTAGLKGTERAEDLNVTQWLELVRALADQEV